jgi:hypothetical protein
MLESDKAEIFVTLLSSIGVDVSTLATGAISFSGFSSTAGTGSATTGGVATWIISGDLTGISSTLP